MTCGIYKIENKLNGKVYIGQSINIEQRWKAHVKAIYGCGHEYDYPIYRSIRLYGLENFEFSIIEKCLKRELNDKEKYYIQEYNSLVPNGYNQAIGGNNHFTKLICDKVELIKKELKESNLSQKLIAEKYEVDDHTISNINNGKSWHDNNIEYPIRKNHSYCIDCGILVNPGSIRCMSCEYERRRQENLKLIKISREELKNKIRNQSFLSIGKEFNVTDNTIRDWCDKYNLPRRKKDIKCISDEDWKQI